MSFYHPERVTAQTFVEIVEYHETLESTNTLAVDLREQLHARTPALVLADEQTAGRGRGTNAWWSSGGALTCSAVLDADRHGPPPEARPMVALGTGLAVRSLVAEMLPDHTVSIKWPNDVLVGDQKICGILSEQHATCGGAVLIVGIGLNVNNSLAAAPDDVRQRATSLFDLTGQSLDLTEILIRLLNKLQSVLRELQVSPIAVAHQAGQFNRLTGRTVTIDSPGQLIRGECVGIADDGALLLRGQEGVQVIRAGSIVDYV